MSIDYAAACQTAASRQGLDPLTDALKVAGIRYDVEQTGGFCMVVTVRNESGVVAAICDGEDTPEPSRPVWLTCFYPGDTWTGGGEPEDERTTGVYAAIRRLVEHAAA